MKAYVFSTLLTAALLGPAGRVVADVADAAKPDGVTPHGRTAMPVDGTWQIRMDREGQGIRKRWFDETFTGDPAHLPGTVDTNPRVPRATQGSLHGFNPAYPYSGKVWYQREVNIPPAWSGKRVVLFLERCQWETFVWLDGELHGVCNSLVAPHEHDLGTPSPGTHRLTVLVDNANRRDGMVVTSDNVIKYTDLTTEVQRGAKLNCGGHHLWSHNWNGIIGRVELVAIPAVSIVSADVYPEVKAGAVDLRLVLAVASGAAKTAAIEAKITPLGVTADAQATVATWTVELTQQPEQRVERRVSLAMPLRLWDEFHPNLYDLTVTVRASDSDQRRLVFGMRELSSLGTQFAVNGRTTFLRSTLECFIFPLSGHPPVDVPSWRKIITIAKSYGLNAFRFHLCCPPEAAFQAADELGFYFQVELPGTSCPSRDEGKDVEEFLSAEEARILRTFGNHPSFFCLSMGNEQAVTRSPQELTGGKTFPARHTVVLENKVRFGQTTDSRHKYTATSHPYSPGRTGDYYQSAWPVQGPGKEPLCGIAWGGGRVIDTSRFNKRAPETVFDYREGIQGIDRPLVTHEVGQWASYPDLRELSRYHGAQRAGNFEIIREKLREKGLLEWANDFTRASGMLALALYKEEIESALRTPGLAGFQLLDLHDFPGQGTSTVGVVNAVWESKGLITPAAFRGFCSPAVPLARLPSRVWTTAQTLSASVDLANFGPADLVGAASWSLRTADGRQVGEGRFPVETVRQGGLTELGKIAIPLRNVSAPSRLVLRVEMAGQTANTWNLWVYPEGSVAPLPSGVTLATVWGRPVHDALAAGGMVLFVPDPKHLKQPIPGTFTPVFWNVIMKHQQVSKTMGLLCDPAHPALASFPTEYHSDWQWWDPVMRSTLICLDGLPAALRPAVTVIDSFTENRRLALLFEARVGRGRLVVCAADILNDLDRRPVARQLRRSILEYMNGASFWPDVEVPAGELDKLFSGERGVSGAASK